MELNQTPFQALADGIVDDVLSAADSMDVEVEICFCLQQMSGPDPQEELAYHLSNGAHSAFIATDSSGRMWYCDCSRQMAIELTPTTDYSAVSRELMVSLGCPATDREYAYFN